GREAACDSARVVRRTKLHPAEAPAQLLPAARPAGPELEGAEAALAHREHDLPDRRCDLGDVERGHDRSSLSSRTAAEAGTEALGLRRGCVREPADVVRLGPGRAGRQAVDARGHDAGDRMLVELVAGGHQVHATSGVVTVNRESGAWPAMTSGRTRRKRASPATA